MPAGEQNGVLIIISPLNSIGSKLNFPGVPLFLVVVLYVLPFWAERDFAHPKRDSLVYGPPKKDDEASLFLVEKLFFTRFSAQQAASLIFSGDEKSGGKAPVLLLFFGRTFVKYPWCLRSGGGGFAGN